MDMGDVTLGLVITAEAEVVRAEPAADENELVEGFEPEGGEG
jgi:hypothetical protein